MGLCIAGRWRSSSAAPFSAPRPEPGRRGLLHSVVSWRLAVTAGPPTSSRQTRIAATVAPLAAPLRREAYHPENSRHRRIYWSAPPCDVPPAIVLETGPVIYKSHNGFWFLVSPTLKELHHDLPAVLRKCWPDWAI